MNQEIKDAFIHYLKFEKSNGLAEGTIKRYLLSLRYLEEELGGDITTLKTYSEVSLLIARIREKRDWSPATTKNTADAAAVFYNYLFRMGHIIDSPFRLGHEFKNRNRCQLDFFDWHAEDFKRLIYDPENSVRENAILHTLRSSGVRASELCNAEQRDYEDRWIKVLGKGGNHRFAPVDKECKFWLDIYVPLLKTRYKGCKLFVNSNYNELTTHTLWKWIYKRGNRLGIRAYPHKFRKSLGGELVKNGADITVAQHVLGHKDVSTTSNYYVGFKKESLLNLYDKFLGKPAEIA